MPSNSEIILSANTHPGDSTTETITGTNFRGDGYYGRSDGVHTVFRRPPKCVSKGLGV